MDATYHATPSTRIQGFSYPLEEDLTGNLKVTQIAGGSAVGTANPLPVTEATLLAGEDLTNNVLKTEERFSYFHYVGGTASTLGTVKSGAGFFHQININQHTSGGTYTLYDSVGTSAAVIGIIDSAGAATPSRLYDVTVSTGLTIVSGSVCDVTISYR